MYNELKLLQYPKDLNIAGLDTMAQSKYALPISVVAAPAVRSKLAFYVLMWYIFASFAVCTSKKITILFPFPLYLCLTQLVVAFLSCSVTAARLGDISYRQVVSGSSRESLIAGILFALGFVFTNMAITCSTVSFAETVKAAESVSTLTLGFIFYSERASAATYLTVLVVCVGVILSCYSSDFFSRGCFAVAALSNICFSGRAIIIKRSKRSNRTTSIAQSSYRLIIEELLRFAEMCLIGALLVLILCFFSGVGSFVAAVADYSLPELREIGLLLLMNGIAFSGYNLLSMLVLAQTELLSHAILNAIRRVCMIVVSVMYFHNNISYTNMVGIAMAAGGGLLFSYVKSFAPTKEV